MSRRAVVVIALVLLALAVAAPAMAKGPTGATITGPGIEGAIVIMGDGELGTGSDFSAFVEDAGFWELVFTADGPPPTIAPEAMPPTEGAVYEITWDLGDDQVVTTVYPEAPMGPVVFVEPGAPLPSFGGQASGGWMIADDTLLSRLAGYGVPVKAEAAPATVTTVAPKTTVPPTTAPATTVAEVPAEVETARAVDGGPDQGSAMVPFAVGAVVIAMGVALVWALGRRPRRVGAP